jgi:PilZ domain
MLAAVPKERIEQDRRDNPRMRCLLQGRLEFNSRSMTLNCAIRNLTDQGARLIFGAAVALPREFELVVESQNRRLKAQLIWSTGLESGVMFL